MTDLVLRIEEPSKPPREIKVVEGMTFGRAPHNKVVLDDPNVSGSHARIVRLPDGDWAVEDLGSSNRTRISGGRNLGKGDQAKLTAGMTFSMGKTILRVTALPAPPKAAKTEMVELESTRLSPPKAPKTEQVARTPEKTEPARPVQPAAAAAPQSPAAPAPKADSATVESKPRVATEPARPIEKAPEAPTGARTEPAQPVVPPAAPSPAPVVPPEAATPAPAPAAKRVPTEPAQPVADVETSPAAPREARTEPARPAASETAPPPAPLASPAATTPAPAEPAPPAVAADEAPAAAPENRFGTAAPAAAATPAPAAEVPPAAATPSPAPAAAAVPTSPAPEPERAPAPAASAPAAPAPAAAAPAASAPAAAAPAPAAAAKPAAPKVPSAADLPPMTAGTREPKSYSIAHFAIDLATYMVEAETIRCADLEDVLGGCARGFKLLENYEVTDAYDPAAPLILNLGILSGTQFMTGLRTYFQGYSPLKCNARHRPSAMWSAGSGDFGTRLRYAGVDEIVFTGRAPMPVYLLITADAEGRPRFQFKNAEHLRGHTINDKVKQLIAKHPDGHIASIGQAGENYKSVRYAAIGLTTGNQIRSGDMKSRFCGRGGFGGVMGSKNLLAIVVDVPDKARGDKVTGLKEVNQIVARGEGSRRFRDKRKGDGGGGTWANMTALNPLHAMPEYNFAPTGTEVSEPLYRGSVEEAGRFLVKDEACLSCGIACHKNLYEKQDGKAGRFRAKFDYEPLNLLSANIGIFDIDQAATLVDLGDEYGMDSISLGVTISYAMEYNRRMKAAGELSIVPSWIEYGSFEGARRAIEEIAHGKLPLLGQGTRRLSEALGETGYAMHAKGVEFPAYLPHFNPGYPWALAGGHMSMRTYLLYVFEREKGPDYWVDAITKRGPLIMRDDIIGICKFSGMPTDVMATTIGAMTGLAIDTPALEKIVIRTFLRGLKLERKVGFEKSDYVLPAEVHENRPEFELEHFNTKEFFEQVRDRVHERFEKMILEEGL